MHFGFLLFNFRMSLSHHNLSLLPPLLYSVHPSIHPSMSSAASNKLWVGNLPSHVSEVHLRSIFAPHGPVERVSIFRHRNYAIVFFRHKANAAAAEAALRHRLTIEFEAGEDSSSGYRFLPTDKELVGFYLYNRVTMASASPIINDCDLYGDKEPWELWKDYGGDDVAEKPEDRCLYFFTELKKKSPKSNSRIERRVGKAGSWKGEDTGTKVAVSENIKGMKKRYKYEGGPEEQHGCWYMLEFSLLEPPRSNIVLCRLKKNEKAQMKNLEKKRKRVEEVTRKEKAKSGGHTRVDIPLPLNYVSAGPASCSMQIYNDEYFDQMMTMDDMESIRGFINGE